MKYIDRLNNIEHNFIAHFGYGCEAPFAALQGDKQAILEYERTVEKSIKDDYDYTVEKYGTVPLKKGDLKQIVIN